MDFSIKKLIHAPAGIFSPKPKVDGIVSARSFKTTIHMEKDRFYDPLTQVRSELVDHYFWTTLTGSSVKAIRQKDFRVNFLGTVKNLGTKAHKHFNSS